jgi:peptide/nickel transport system permease protein
MASSEVERAVALTEVERAEQPDVTTESVTRRRSVDLGFTLAITWFAIIVVAALLADVLPLIEPNTLDAAAGRAGPSAAHWLGADMLGRDIFSRIVYGARTSLVVGLLATLLSGFVGMTLGLLGGYYRGAAESMTMGAMDILLSFPALVLAIALTAALGAGIGNVIVAIAILALPAFARIARAETMAYADREFVKAAKSLGAKPSRVILREIAPNVLPTMVAYAFVTVAVAIVVEGSLSFLGLGVPVETPTWGGMIAHGRSVLDSASHLSMFPAAAMFLTVLALNTIGDKLRQRDSKRGGVEA